jgi:hypothetical protein
MSISRKKCIESFINVLKNGTEYHVHEWDREMIEQTEFYHLNWQILDQPRGSGYWLWKPYIICKAMLDMKDGDILVYSDAGVEFVNHIEHILEVMDGDVFLFGNNYNHVDWCKGDVLNLINPAHNIEGRTDYRVKKQVQASVIFFRIGKESKEFAKEWLLYCQMPNLIDDSPSKTDNYPTFAEHRHDQAILTCLQIKYGYKLHYWPAQYNNGAFVYEKLDVYSQDKYPIIFHHTRKRNNEY